MVPKPSKADLEGLVRQIPTEPPKIVPPQITLQLTPSGVSIGSNIPNVFMAVGILIAGVFGLLMKNQDDGKQEPSRIIKLNP